MRKNVTRSAKNGSKEAWLFGAPWLLKDQPKIVTVPQCPRNHLSTSAVLPVPTEPVIWTRFVLGSAQARSRNAISSSRPINVGFTGGSLPVNERCLSRSFWPLGAPPFFFQGVAQ